jgi:hypothetical protein
VYFSVLLIFSPSSFGFNQIYKKIMPKQEEETKNIRINAFEMNRMDFFFFFLFLISATKNCDCGI